MSFTFGNIAAIVGGLLLIAIGAILIRAAMLPADFRISRSMAMGAAPDKVGPLIANLHRFNEWNPFLKLDSAATVNYSGAEQGPGARCNWSSAGQAGIGNMTVTDVKSQAIAMDLNFEKPFSARNKIVFGLMPSGGGGTEVSWTMTGKRPFLHRVLSLFVSFDRMIGGEFENGLRDLKSRIS